MSKPAPRLAGRSLQIVAGLLRSPITGPPLRRVLSAQSVDKKLDHIDFEAEGNPAPLYMPPAYAPSDPPEATASPPEAKASEEPR